MNIDTQSHTGQRLQRYQRWTKAPQRDLFSRQARWSLQIKSVRLLNHWALVAWFVILNFYGYLSCDLLLSVYDYTKMPWLYSLSEFVVKSSVKFPSLMVWIDFHFFRNLLPSPLSPPLACHIPSQRGAKPAHVSITNGCWELNRAVIAPNICMHGSAILVWQFLTSSFMNVWNTPT